MSEQRTDQWRYKPGDMLVRESQYVPSIEGVGKVTDGKVYEVKKRLVDQESGQRYYWTEYTVGNGTDNQLYDAEMVENLFQKPSGGDSDG